MDFGQYTKRDVLKILKGTTKGTCQRCGKKYSKGMFGICQKCLDKQYKGLR